MSADCPLIFLSQKQKFSNFFLTILDVCSHFRSLPSSTKSPSRGWPLQWQDHRLPAFSKHRPKRDQNAEHAVRRRNRARGAHRSTPWKLINNFIVLMALSPLLPCTSATAHSHVIECNHRRNMFRRLICSAQCSLCSRRSSHSLEPLVDTMRENFAQTPSSLYRHNFGTSASVERCRRIWHRETGRKWLGNWQKRVLLNLASNLWNKWKIPVWFFGARSVLARYWDPGLIIRIE